MAYELAKCPQCGGELQLDSDFESAFCMHCGSKIIVKEAIRNVRINNDHLIDSWSMLADSAYNAQNYKEAYEYYKKIIEYQMDNWKAILFKGLSAGWQSTFSNPRLSELLQSLSDAEKSPVWKKMTDQAKEKAYETFIKESLEIAFAVANLANKNIIKQSQSYGSNLEIMTNGLRQILYSLEFADNLFTKIDNHYYGAVNSLKQNYYKIVCYCIYNLCEIYDNKDFNGNIREFGLPLETKEPLFERFYTALYEIRKIEPSYMENEILNASNLFVYNVYNSYDLNPKNEIDRARQIVNWKMQNDAIEKLQNSKYF